jgi:hypothetical protein
MAPLAGHRPADCIGKGTLPPLALPRAPGVAAGGLCLGARLGRKGVHWAGDRHAVLPVVAWRNKVAVGLACQAAGAAALGAGGVRKGRCHQGCGCARV